MNRSIVIFSLAFVLPFNLIGQWQVSLEERINSTPFIIVGETVKVIDNAFEEGVVDSPYFKTTYVIKVKDVLKGEIDTDEIEVLVRAGKVDKTQHLHISHIAVPFHKGQSAVLFLHKIDFDSLRKNESYGLLSMQNINATENGKTEYSLSKTYKINRGKIEYNDEKLSLKRLKKLIKSIP